MDAGISFDSTAQWDKLRRCVGNEIMTTTWHGENREQRTENPSLQHGLGPGDRADAVCGISQMTRVTRSVLNQASAWTNGPMRLRQGGRFHAFSKKCFTRCNIFLKKRKRVPCCRRRIGLATGETLSLIVHRKMYFASDRAEPTILFHEHLAR